ncbi:hypothetical protein BH18CHL2_BH18CHL2_09350 [soil metagenome]
MARRLHLAPPGARAAPAEQEKMATIILILIAGIAIGVLVAGFVALGAYKRGYSDVRLR